MWTKFLEKWRLKVTFPHSSGKSVPSTGDRSRGPGRNCTAPFCPLSAELRGLGGRGGWGSGQGEQPVQRPLRQETFLPVQRMAKVHVEWMSKEMWERREQKMLSVWHEGRGIQIHIPRKAVVTERPPRCSRSSPLHRLPLLCFLSQHTCRF